MYTRHRARIFFYVHVYSNIRVTTVYSSCLQSLKTVSRYYVFLGSGTNNGHTVLLSWESIKTKRYLQWNDIRITCPMCRQHSLSPTNMRTFLYSSYFCFWYDGKKFNSSVADVELRCHQLLLAPLHKHT